MSIKTALTVLSHQFIKNDADSMAESLFPNVPVGAAMPPFQQAQSLSSPAGDSNASFLQHLIDFADRAGTRLVFCPMCFGGFGQNHKSWCPADWKCCLHDDIDGIHPECPSSFGNPHELARHIVDFHPSVRGEPITRERAFEDAQVGRSTVLNTILRPVQVINPDGQVAPVPAFKRTDRVQRTGTSVGRVSDDAVVVVAKQPPVRTIRRVSG